MLKSPPARAPYVFTKTYYDAHVCYVDTANICGVSNDWVYFLAVSRAKNVNWESNF